jgi:capsular polysaccharide biosynthesis protein
VLKVLIIACAAVIIVCIGFNWWKKRIAQKNKEQEDLERTLKTPLETFGTEGSIDELAKKYEDNDTSQ